MTLTHQTLPHARLNPISDRPVFPLPMRFRSCSNAQFTFGFSRLPTPAQMRASLADQLGVDQLRKKFRKYAAGRVAPELPDFYKVPPICSVIYVFSKTMFPFISELFFVPTMSQVRKTINTLLRFSVSLGFIFCSYYSMRTYVPPYYVV